MTTVLVSGEGAERLLKKLRRRLDAAWPRWNDEVRLSCGAKSAEITVVAGGGAAICGRAIVWEDFCGKLTQSPLRCGFGSGCDLFFSSISRRQVCVCLTAEQPRPDGGRAYPKELCLPLGAGEPFAVLAAAAIKILCNNLPE